MKASLTIALVLACGGALLAGQEREAPADSTRISIPGCADGRRFIVAPPIEGETVRTTLRPGRRFRLEGPKKILSEIKTQKRSMIEVTGLVRKGQLEERGVATAGGRVRIGGGAPRATVGDAGRDPGYNEVVIDVEGWRPLPASCPAR